MKCKDQREMIEAYIENNMDPMVDENLRKHLEECEDCREYLKFYSAYKKEINQFPQKDVPVDLFENIEIKIRRNELGRREKISLSDIFDLFRRRFSYEAIGIVGLALIMIVVYKPFTIQDEIISESEVITQSIENNTDYPVSKESEPKEKSPITERIIIHGIKQERISKSKSLISETNESIVKDVVSDDSQKNMDEKISGEKSNNIRRNASNKKSRYDAKSPFKKKSGLAKSNFSDLEKIAEKNDIVLKDHVSVIAEKHNAQITLSTFSSPNAGKYQLIIDTVNEAAFMIDLCSSYEVKIIKRSEIGKKVEIYLNLKKK